ncbi:holo-ACP synthase [Castellaniella sp. S9]|uniref:holo-ACP synthase n=1 Tax=Castellaniella sp. S9 TaxID=2993652 RepID=UPI0022B4D1C0|nr:holo-ACP synthase [Castellaniella sp. S9]
MSAPGIAGIGTDLLRIERIERVYARHGERFVARILGADEQVVFRRRAARDPRRGIRYLATRFAAKEAFSKAIGLGMHMPMAWSRMQVVNLPGGRPGVRLSGPLAEWYAERFGTAHISLTDEDDMAAAFVVIEALPALAEARPS